MITFDKIKLVSCINYIQNVSEEKFEIRYNDYDIKSMSFKMNSPFLLYLEIDYEKDELIIEFTGKILGKDYPKLISVDTIHQCLNTINAMGLGELSIDAILNDSEVVKCDVTRDVDCDDLAGLTTYINANVKSHRQYTCRVMKNANFIIEKNVTTKDYKKRLTIYSKEREMHKIDNIRYMDTYNYRGDEFEGKCRFEMNLNSKAQIRKALDIDNTRLMNVLTADADPICDFLQEVLADEVSGWTPSSKKEYEASLVLRDCGYDLEAVEAKLKSIAGASFRPSRDLVIYRTILSRGQMAGKFSKNGIIDMARGVSK